MDANWHTWESTSSGSGAFEPWTSSPWQDVLTSTWASTLEDVLDTNEVPQNDEEQLAYTTQATFGAGDLPHGALMSAKVPPAYDGRGSWFNFEELVYDWEDSCLLGKELRGPALKNRLSGEAAVYKPMLNRDLLKEKETGVEYFLSTLRPHFVKGVQSVFLHRLFQFMRMRRGRLEITRWVPKYALMRKRLHDSWMDLFEKITVNHPSFMEHATALANVYRRND